MHDESRYEKPEFRISEMIMALGGDHVIPGLMLKHKFPVPEVASVGAWRRRNSAPGSWALALLYLCVREGILDSLDRIRVMPAEDKE